MSDLLLMRGGGLRSLTHTPGLVACYLPWLQIAQGATGQTLLDYSPQGNDAQLGSTAGVDANDPAWGTGGKWLEFDGVDDYIPLPAELHTFTDKTIVAVAKGSDYGLVSLGSSTSWSIGLSLIGTQVDKNPTYKYILTNSPGSTSWHFVATRARYNDMSILFNRDDVLYDSYVENSNYNLNPAVTHRIGRAIRDYLTGDIAAVLIIERSVTDSELERIRSNLKTLLLGHGVDLP